MNRKRKILTIVALAVFGAIIWLNYDGLTTSSLEQGWRIYYERRAEAVRNRVKVQLLALAVGYAGLFAILGDKKRDSQ